MELLESRVAFSTGGAGCFDPGMGMIDSGDTDRMVVEAICSHLPVGGR